MSDAKPLHVQVAEALGWQEIKRCGDLMIPQASGYDGRPPGAVFIVGHPGEEREKVPRFDLEWSATGPLIEKYGIRLEPTKEAHGYVWGAWVREHGNEGYRTHGLTPLVAVCHLIVAVGAEGGL